MISDDNKANFMHSKSMRRAERSARAITHGAKILQFVQSPSVRQRLVQAAELGSPPVTAISSDVQKLVGKKDAKLPPIKQYTGLCVRAVLEEEGFELVQTGVRVSKDPIFRTGSFLSTFRKAGITVCLGPLGAVPSVPHGRRSCLRA